MTCFHLIERSLSLSPGLCDALPHSRCDRSRRRSWSGRKIEMGQIQYSEKYFDDTYEYRHVVLPPEVAKLLPKNRLLSENEWRAIGVQQSRGMGALRDPPPGAAHHALPAAAQLPAAAGEPGRRRSSSCCPSSPQVMYYNQQ
ncbi:unnamed protein product [Musa acuminata subsp. burmannicoides]